ncbi:MAG: hypothetical protein DI551_08170 [Micavibrio aeruginosavorus]|uniref:DUF2336 domain-containing protein n=1 Tax=Micavibrio aeruginosavorus TaxID=349221 RepID=A0A2W5PRS6_9BACT|nr:MAG: hypothetical protein DI551_08170 [Micavibrio aeruginosavorus]
MALIPYFSPEAKIERAERRIERACESIADAALQMEAYGRMSAITKLADIGGKYAAEYIARIGEFTNAPIVTKHAADKLKTMPNGVKLIGSMADSDTPYRASDILEALEKIGTKEAYAVMVNVAQRMDNQTIDEEVAKALISDGGEIAMGLLQTHALDRPRVIPSAIAMLRKEPTYQSAVSIQFLSTVADRTQLSMTEAANAVFDIARKQPSHDIGTGIPYIATQMAQSISNQAYVKTQSDDKEFGHRLRHVLQEASFLPCLDEPVKEQVRKAYRDSKDIAERKFGQFQMHRTH